jgi:hypothetical protein
MKRVLVAALFLTVVAFGGIVTPDSFAGPYCLSPAFGMATCAIGDEYKAGGLLFSQMGVETAVFNDPPDAWGGINGQGIVDLLAPVNGAIVVPGTITPAVTGYLAVEAGSAAPGNLLLTVYDVGGNILGSRVNGLDGTGPHGSHLIILSIPGIRSFSVSTPEQDTFGVDQIEVGSISGGGVPEPVSMVLVGSGLALLAYRRRRK